MLDADQRGMFGCRMSFSHYHTKIMARILVMVRDRLKSFYPQHGDDVTCQYHSSNIIEHALKDIPEDFNYFGRSVIV